MCIYFFFFFSSRRRHTRCSRDWSSDVCSSDLFLEEWLRGAVLRRDGRPAIYLYAVEYRLPSGAVRTMRGFLSLVKLEEFGTGRIFPHENTRAAAKRSEERRVGEECRSRGSADH